MDADPARVIRVFVSSTFRDMVAERDYLSKHTFPALRKLCEQRGVTWSDVDLRWGITDERAAEDQVLPICLAEIERSRPYFIGLLGDRYGWVPESIPDDLGHAEPWLANYRGASITELEIMHGVLRNPDMRTRAHFYFRSDAASARAARDLSLPAEPEASREKLARLKRSIRDSRARGHCTLREPYESPEMLGRLVAEDFEALLDDRHPHGSLTDPLEPTRIAQAAFARARSRVYVKSGDTLDALNRFLRTAHQGTGAVVSGPPGAGKSALLASWAASLPASIPVISHYVEASPEGADGDSMLRRLMRELSRRFDLQHAVPDDAAPLRSAFNSLLNAASTSARGPCVVLIDGLDRVAGPGTLTALGWLPPVVPGNVRLVVSSRSAGVAAALQRTGWTGIAVPPLSIDERIDLTKRYLSEYSKELSAGQLARIKAADPTGNPLYLRTLLDELRIFGSHERLDAEIDRYLAAGSVPELFRLVLARCERDYDPPGRQVVKPALSMLWAAHTGLTEAELLDLLGQQGERLPRALWSPVFLALEGALFNRSGTLSVAHEYFSEAIAQAYLAEDSEQRSLHGLLAAYFDREAAWSEISAGLGAIRDQPASTPIPLRRFAEAGISARKRDELPWQLAGAAMWPRLYALFTDYEFLAAVWKSDPEGVRRLWDRLETEGGFNREKAYSGVVHGEEIPSWWARRAIIQLLEHQGRGLGELLRLMETARLTQSPDAGAVLTDGMMNDPDFADWMLDLYSSDLAGRPDTREERARLAELASIASGLGRKQALVRIWLRATRITVSRGEFNAAEDMLIKAETVAAEVHDEALVAEVFTIRAGALAALDADGRAIAALDRQQEISRRLGCWSLLARGLNIGAELALRRKEADRCLELAREAESLGREHGFADEIERALFAQGVALRRQGQTQAGLERLVAAEEYLRTGLRRSPLEPDLSAKLAENLVTQAVLSVELGDRGRALRLADEAAQTSQRFPAARNRRFVESALKWVRDKCP